MVLLTRRAVSAGLLAMPALVRTSSSARAAPRRLKISHQFPGTTGNEGDFRDRLVGRFAAEVERRSNGELAFDIYPGSSLMKTNAQFSALRKGALDLSLFPIAYGGGEVPECNIGQLPGVITSYEQGLAWRTKPVGQALEAILASKGIVLLTWVWQAAGCVSKEAPLVAPADAKGVKARGASREMDVVLQKAGATVVSFPSNELYVAMQTGVCQAAISSSTSLLSFRMDELAKHLASGKGEAYLFTFQPLLMSKAIFDSLPEDQRRLLTEVGLAMQDVGLKGAQADDEKIETAFRAAGAEVHPLTDDVVGQWRSLAKETAWVDYAGRNAGCAKLLAMAAES